MTIMYKHCLTMLPSLLDHCTLKYCCSRDHINKLLGFIIFKFHRHHYQQHSEHFPLVQRFLYSCCKGVVRDLITVCLTLSPTNGTCHKVEVEGILMNAIFPPLPHIWAGRVHFFYYLCICLSTHQPPRDTLVASRG